MAYYKKHRVIESSKTVNGEVKVIVDLLISALKQEMMGYSPARDLDLAEMKARHFDIVKIAHDMDAKKAREAKAKEATYQRLADEAEMVIER